MFFESFMLNLTVILVLIIALTFDYVTKFFSYWYVRHIPNNTPVPFFGTDYLRVLGLRSNTEDVNILYSQHPKEMFVGSVKSRIPDLIVKDPDAIKTILSTGFANFHRRGLALDKSRDVCIRNNLFYAEGEKWTLLRKGLETILNDLKLESEDSLHDCLSGTNGDTNVQQLLSEVLDVIFKDLLLGQKSDGAAITRLRSALQKRTFGEKLKTYFKYVFPSLFTLFRMATISGEPSSMTKKDVESSKLLTKIKNANIFEMGLKEKNKNMRMNNTDFAYAVLSNFITEGYIPCLNLLTAHLHDLAMNKEVQEKARASEHYLEATIKESLRLHPPYSTTTRQCVKMYHYPQTRLVIDRNVTINVPIEAIHRDEKYFADANKYIPDRFLATDNNPEQTFAYLPFGVGPRKCIGERLSLDIIRCVSKLILQKYQLEPCAATPQQLSMADQSFGRVVDRDIWLRFNPISS
ncbi:hypothetical protein ACJJTC_016696 [Scirpophaga incertulas]